MPATGAEVGVWACGVCVRDALRASNGFVYVKIGLLSCDGAPSAVRCSKGVVSRLAADPKRRIEESASDVVGTGPEAGFPSAPAGEERSSPAVACPTRSAEGVRPPWEEVGCALFRSLRRAS